MERSNEIVEMEKGPDGSYQESSRKVMRRVPQGYPYYRPSGAIGKFHEFLGGFVIGLDAIERFFEVMRRGYRR